MTAVVRRRLPATPAMSLFVLRFHIVLMGPDRGRRDRAPRMRAHLACLSLATILASVGGPAFGQALTSDLLRPVAGGFVAPQDMPLRRTEMRDDEQPRDRDAMAPSRIGKIPTYGSEVASGASDSGFNSLNRKRKAPKPYPGAPKQAAAGTAPPSAASIGLRRLPLPPSASAHRAPLAPAITGSVPGQPDRRQLKVDNDPYGALGVYVGSFLVKSAVEIGGGYDTNPARFTVPRGSSFYRIAPELLAATDWSRHSVIVDLRGSFTGFGNTFPALPGQASSAPENVDRIELNGKVAGRLDISRDTRANAEFRLRVGADNPGSPNLQAGLARFPLFTATGGSIGVEQDFNRLQLRMDGTIDRVVYQNSTLTDGTRLSNADRDYSQYGGVGRVSYEVLPGLKPFGEIQADTRVHDTPIDRNGYRRDSTGGYVKAGTTFEYSRLLIGELSIGYASRSYADPRLNNLKGLLSSASLVWSATPLTTARFIATTSLDETTIPGVPGVLTRTYTFEVNHDFRRWLTAVGRFTYGTQDYQESTRFDQIYSLSGDVIYRLNRDIQIKAQVRRDLLQSSIPSASTASTVVMLGVRLQR